MGFGCHLSNHFHVGLSLGIQHGQSASWAAVWMAAVAIAIAPGCSSSGEEDTPDTSSTDQAIADWIHPSCDASSLGPPSGDAQSCNGPWAFTYQEFWQNPDACGAAFCSAYNTCTSWDLNAQGDGQGYTVQSWTEISDSYGYGTNEYGSYGLPPESVCPGPVAGRKNQLIASQPGMSPSAAAGLSVDWGTANERVNQGVDDTGRPWFDISGQCTLIIQNFPTPMTGAHPWCGCQTMTQPECPRTPGGTFTSADVPKSIPDNNTTGVTSTITGNRSRASCLTSTAIGSE